ncbi:MAG TPA: DUF5060 domain-containing protein, partial [Sedimentisphaerales bacterium]|nr:DUF5060 domain-containing protein [Sedimentisphaerales bacterium]
MAKNWVIHSLLVISLWLSTLCPAATASFAHRGYFELSLESTAQIGNPFTDVELKVVFERPNGSEVPVEGFYDGQ